MCSCLAVFGGMTKQKKRPRETKVVEEAEPIQEASEEEVPESGSDAEESGDDEDHEQQDGGDDSSTGGEESEEDEDEAEDRRAVKKLMRAKPAQQPDNGDIVPSVPVSHFDGTYKNKQRVLTLCSRGVTARARHLLEDLRKLIPHSKKEVKLDCKGKSEPPLIHPTNLRDGCCVTSLTLAGMLLVYR